MVRADHHGEHRKVYAKNKKIILASQTVCGICGQQVDKTLKYPNPLAPCVDHIIPLSKGGHPSSITNLQLAHWTCNRQKSDKLNLKDEVAQEENTSLFPLSVDWSSYKAE